MDLDAVRGLGPATIAKLGAAGIGDVETLALVDANVQFKDAQFFAHHLWGAWICHEYILEEEIVDWDDALVFEGGGYLCANMGQATINAKALGKYGDIRLPVAKAVEVVIAAAKEKHAEPGFVFYYSPPAWC